MRLVTFLFLLLLFFFSGNLNKSSALDRAVSEKKTKGSNREAVYYFPVEDESPEAIPYSQTGNGGKLAIVAGAVAVAAVAGYFLLRKKQD